MSRVYVFGPLAGVLLGVTLSFLRVRGLAWLPVAISWLLAVSLVGAMWKALRSASWGGRRRGELAMLLAALPGVSAVAAFFVIGRWPPAVRDALPDLDEELSGPLFVACAALWSLASAGIAAYAVFGGEMLGVVVGALGMLFFVFWLPASRQAVDAIEALDEVLGAEESDAPAAEWARERDAVRAALVTGGGADRAWAQDVIVRHARRGEDEARRWAEAMVSDDPEALPAALAGRVVE